MSSPVLHRAACIKAHKPTVYQQCMACQQASFKKKIVVATILTRLLLKRFVLALGNTTIKAALWVDVSVSLLVYECLREQERVRASRLTIVVSVLSID